MKFVIGLAIAAGAMMLVGCTANTPAYTAGERFAQIHRNQVFEGEAFNDDIDDILLLRPSSQLSIWNVYHRD